jgi:MFS family permease
MTPSRTHPQAQARATGYLGLLRRNRDFRLLYFATLISLGGDWFLFVALQDLVLQLSGSALLSTLVQVCQTLPNFLCAPFSGHLIDKLDRRRLIIVVNCLCAVAALLPLLARSAALLPLAYLGVVLIGVGESFLAPAADAALPNLVDKEDLQQANVLFNSTWGTMLVLGAALGGLITLALGRNAAFLLDGLSFLVAALLVLRVRASFSEAREAGPGHEHPPLWRAMRQTLDHARTHPRVRALLLVKGGYALGAGAIAMLGVFGREIFHAGTWGIGSLLSARGAGALLGPFLVRELWPARMQQYRLLPLCIIGFGLGYAGLAVAPVLWLGLLLVGVAHLGGGAQWVISTTGLQEEVPDRLRGRVLAVDYGLFTLSMAMSSLLAGALSTRLGAPVATAIIACLSVLWGVGWGLFTFRLWRQPPGG